MIVMQLPRPIPVEVLRDLAQAGASDHLLGLAVRELLAAEGAQPKRPVFTADTVPANPGLREGPDSANPPPTGYPRPLERPQDAPGIAPGHAAIAKKIKPVIVGLRDSLGKRTSVSFSEDRWVEMLLLEPDDKALSALIRQIGSKAPADSNRSNWTYDAVVAQLQGK